MKRSLTAMLPLALALSGCASTSARPGFRDMAQAVEDRIGHKIYWNQSKQEDAKVEEAVEAMIKEPLSAASAVQIALLYNRSLQATYEELSVAQADVVQAGLLRNPVFSASLGFRTGIGGDAGSIVTATPEPKVGLGVEIDFLGLLLLSARKTLAGSQFEEAKLRVGDAVLGLAADVRRHYYELQGALQVMAMRRTIDEAAEASAELAQRQEEAGTLSELNAANERALFQGVRLELAASELETQLARERLTRLMGLWGPKTTWEIPARLPELPAKDPDLSHVESLAIARRFDVAAARQSVQSIAHALSITSGARWIGGSSVGVATERDLHEPWTVGPEVNLELPIFDQGQASMARLEAELRQGQHKLAALAVEARSEVRAVRVRVAAARATAEYYRGSVIPLRERIVALSQQHYDAMLLGVYQLIQAKQSEVDAYRQYIEAVRDYWIAWSDLERASGGRISPPQAASQPTKAKAHEGSR